MSKFKEFYKACEQDTPMIVVADLRVIGDTVEETKDNINVAIKN